jgi:hypothetical protein
MSNSLRYFVLPQKPSGRQSADHRPFTWLYLNDAGTENPGNGDFSRRSNHQVPTPGNPAPYATVPRSFRRSPQECLSEHTRILTDIALKIPWRCLLKLWKESPIESL